MRDSYLHGEPPNLNNPAKFSNRLSWPLTGAAEYCVVGNLDIMTLIWKNPGYPNQLDFP